MTWTGRVPWGTPCPDLEPDLGPDLDGKGALLYHILTGDVSLTEGYILDPSAFIKLFWVLVPFWHGTWSGQKKNNMYSAWKENATKMIFLKYLSWVNFWIENLTCTWKKPGWSKPTWHLWDQPPTTRTYLILERNMRSEILKKWLNIESFRSV